MRPPSRAPCPPAASAWQSARRRRSPPLNLSPSRAAVSSDADRLVGGGAGERELEEAARALGLTAHRRDLRRARERANAIGRRLAARDLTLVEIDDVDRLRRELREALEERLDVGGRDEGEALLAVADRVGARHAGLRADLGLAHELVAAILALHLAREQLVRDDERVVVARLHGELLEVLGELLVGALRANELDRDAARRRRRDRRRRSARTRRGERPCAPSRDARRTTTP